MTELNNYHVFPRHVGSWEGTVSILDANLQESQRYTIKQQFATQDNHWTITNTYVFSDSTSASQSFDVTPVGDGKVTVTTAEPHLHGCRMEAIECGADVINFMIVNTETGKIQELETVTLIGENTRCRTAQLFDPAGVFKGLLVVAEQRQAGTPR